MADTPPTSARLALLGGAALHHGNGAGLRRLERKAAALLAYLVLEGEASRTQLGGLLWPQVPEAVARNNLAQLLRRMKSLAGDEPLVEGKDRLRLATAIEIDLRELLVAERAGALERLADTRGELLAGMDYGDCEAFGRWLEGQRERLHRLRCEALTTLAENALAAGQPRPALGHLLRLVDADRLSESAHRLLMRTHAALGDLAAAEVAFERCRKLMWEELGVPPSAETRALHDELQRQAARAESAGTLHRRRPPYALFRPPHFVGREAALTRMQAAWDEHKGIFVTGDAGVGKTRLMQEFLADKGRYYLFEGLPQDAGTPYATYSRTLRQAMQAFPGLRPPDWMMAEVARLLPELGGTLGAPVEENDRLRFFHALAEANDLLVRAGMRQVVADDLHWADLASLELGHFIYARQWGRPGGMRSLMLARRDEMDAASVQAMDWVLDRGYAIEVHLDALDEAATAELLAGIEPAWRDWAPRLHRHTGGNPGMLLETLRAVYAEDGLAQGLPAHLPVTEQVTRWLERRLARLTPDALKLARLAALAEPGLDAAQAALLLECAPAELLEVWTALQRAGILDGGRPAHDSLRQVLLAGIPQLVQAHLRQRIEAL
ncbi:MAG: hypothetical protein Fur0039_05800 [Rhodocyclaceae bacterium]